MGPEQGRRPRRIGNRPAGPTTEPEDEDRALPVEADLAGETAVALTQASSTNAEPGDAPAVAEAVEAVPATNGGDDTGDDTGHDPAGVELTADDRIGSCTSTPPR